MEAEAGKQTIGLVARYMSQFLRRINVKLAKTESVVVFINQIRQRVGVLYGCFHADTNIVFADGSLHSIKEVVENKLEGPILSYDSDTGTIKEEKIINWFNNGKLQDGQCWLSFKTTSNYQSVNGFTCTPNHQILKSNGEYCCAEDLKIGDKLISYKTEKIIHNQIYKEMIFASMLGDGTLSIRSGHTASFLLANKQQEEYLQWKLEKLKYLNFKLKTTKKHCYYSEYSNELKDFYDVFYKKKIDGKMTRTIPDGLTLTPLMAAIWYMDDGNTHRRQGRICISRIQKLNKDEYDHQVFLLKKIVSDFIGCNIDKLEYSEKDNQLKIKTDEFAIFCSKIEKYVIPSMQYKLIPECQGKYEDFDSGNLNIITQKADFVEITEIVKNSKRKMRSQTKYDIEVENQHCYFVGGSHGVVVHNSPDTTGGGNALKFYSSIRMQVSKNADGMIKEKDKVVGQGIRVRIVKNKTAPPFRVAEFSVYFDGRKQSETDQIASIAIENGLIPKYNAKGERDKNGRQYKWNTVPEFLAKSKAEVPEMLDKFPQVREELLEMIKNGTYNEDEQSSELEADMDDESFEEMMKNESFSEAEEIESDFDEV